jgi:hypothetical protein
MTFEVYNQRMMINAQNQKDWADQQVREKRFAIAQEKADDHAYAQQTDALTRMRGMLEDENTMKR